MFFNVNFLANLMARIFCYFLRFDVIVVIGILKQKRREKYFFQTNHILVIKRTLHLPLRNITLSH